MHAAILFSGRGARSATSTGDIYREEAVIGLEGDGRNKLINREPNNGSECPYIPSWDHHRTSPLRTAWG